MSIIFDFLTHSTNNFPTKFAIITKESMCTYEELRRLSNSASSALSKYPQNSVISIIFENSIVNQINSIENQVFSVGDVFIGAKFLLECSDRGFISIYNSSHIKIVGSSKELKGIQNDNSSCRNHDS